MGLRCTVLGHKWGEVDTERDRQEDGGEVVVAVREVRTCRRCGSEDVLGESKEVTAIDPPEAEDDGDHGQQPGAGAPEQPVHDGSARDPETDDGVILEEGDDEPAGNRDPREWPGRPEREGVEERDGDPEPWPESAREPDADPPEEAFVGADEVPDHMQAPDDGEREAASDDAAEHDAAAGGDADEEGRDIPEPDDDGIIEAGGAPADEGPDDPAVDDDSEAPAPEDPRADGAAAADAGGAAEADGVDIPLAEDDAAPEAAGDEAPEAAGGDAAEAAGGNASGDAGTAAHGEQGDGNGGTEQGDGNGGASEQGDGRVGDDQGDDRGGADEQPAMGADATPRPEDDAEVLEATEPNEQSRITAEDPVDPADPAAEPSGGTSGPGDDSAATGGPPDRADGPDQSVAPGTGDAAEEPAPDDVEFYCPECGYVDDSTWPSRRAGDICPDCQRSYLADRKT